jgi:hypothetical protein
VLQIEKTIVRLEVLEERFCCDPAACRGECCVQGDAGAPLEKEEEREIRENYTAIARYMKPGGVAAVERAGFSVIDQEGDPGTPLIDGQECAYAIEEGGCCCCAIERAWAAGESRFRKPISCHLYPLRVTRYPTHELMRYDRWNLCEPARARGDREGIPLYLFLKDALVRKYGEEWYGQLCHAVSALRDGTLKP